MTNKRPTKLYRIPRDAKLMGVCAGLADYLGVNVTGTRVLTILAIIFTGVWPLLFVYFILGFALDPQPADLYEDKVEEEFWKETRRSPEWTSSELRRRFRDIDKRTADMEAYMTSKRFRLDRELRDLER